MAQPLLSVRDLTVSFPSSEGSTPVVDGVSFDLDAGETLGLVGESGCGKSMTALSIPRLLEGTAATTGPRSSVRFLGQELVGATAATLRAVRGAGIGFVFQEPMTSLNPVQRIGKQIEEAIRAHESIGRSEGRAKAKAWLARVGFEDADRVARSYPHELSGGMRQRALLAMAMACEPSLLIADEPTTALDVTVQAEILALLRTLQDETGLGLLFISHDLAVISQVAQRVAVMVDGRFVEEGPSATVLTNPADSYTEHLLRAAPSLAEPGRSPSPADEKSLPVLEARGVARTFEGRGRNAGHRAVEDVSLSVHTGETLALVGETGSGKSTLGRMLAGLVEPTTGEVRFDGNPLSSLDAEARIRFRRTVQIVFQDPYASLNPRMTVGAAIGEVLAVHGMANGSHVRPRVEELLERVGLDSGAAKRYPHQFSGGQRQRIGIARALAVGPKLLVADEPVSALDVSVQARILGLLSDLRDDLGLGYLFISHDLAVVRGIADRVAVMRRGRIVEMGEVEEVYTRPRSDYTKSLLEAIPTLPNRA